MHYFKQTSKANPSRHTFIVVTAAVLSGLIVITVTKFSHPPALPHLQSNATSLNANAVRPVPLSKKDKEAVVISGQGEVQGKVLESREGRKYFAFYDVPYAKPPVGPLRFKLPEPADGWEGVRDGTQIGLECVQNDKYAPVVRAKGREDCLYLNVYTPKLAEEDGSNPELPVMVYIHGGEFKTGNGSRYGADYFMDEDVITVTFNYRLGQLGFLTTDDEEIPGNLGLKDCIMALRWVQKYIEAYGGDPASVTLFGNSSGGTMVHALMLSHMSRGLFHRAISESGTALLAGGALPVGKPFAVNLGLQLGCPKPNSTKELADCLRSIDAEAIQTAEGPFVLPFPVVEKIPENGNISDVIFSKSPIEIIEDGDNFPNKVPWIVGDNSAEQLGTALKTLKDPVLVEALNTDWAGNIASLMRFRAKPSEEKLNKIKSFYLPFHLNITNGTRQAFVDLLSDQNWVHATKTAAVAHARHSPVYLYWLTKEPARSYAVKEMSGFSPPFGVAHADELQYLFLYEGYPEIPIGSKYTRFSQLLVSSWVSFATTDRPGIEDWKQIDPADDGETWYELGDECGETRRLRRRLRFWEDFKQEMYY